MKTPPAPINEAQRLDALHSLRILDTPPEERFDRLTRLARRLFDVPQALVSLVDEDRQWFKSHSGTEVTETPRDVSFCGHAILGDEVFVVPDACQDPRFADNPLVTGEPGIRFYAGCPLSVGSGLRIGTLCIVDYRAREFSTEDAELLQDLARMAEQELSAIRMATVDELTQLCNRRGFEALGDHALSLCRRLDRPSSLLYLDLDRFKAVNDLFGHAEGDRLLRHFGGILKDTFRNSDVLGRIGGDEFVVLVTNTLPSDLDELLQRLQDAVTAYNRTTCAGHEIHYSVGAVAFDPDRHQTTAAFMADADEQMYRHKQAKRRAANHP
jgi:diguanylate cyclase (GGDEF)-like protein